MAGFFSARQSAGEVRDDLPRTVLAEAFFSLTSSFVIMRTFLGFAAPDAGSPTFLSTSSLSSSGTGLRSDDAGPS